MLIPVIEVSTPWPL